MLNCLGTPGKWATDPQEAGIENGANFEVQVEQKIDKDKAEEIEKVKDKDDGDEEEEAEGKSQSKIVKGWHIFPDECKWQKNDQEYRQTDTRAHRHRDGGMNKWMDGHRDGRAD